MAMYLVLGKYSASGAAGLLADGLASRIPVSEKVLEAGGGKLHHWYALADGDWHIAMIVERPDSYSHAEEALTTLFAASTGVYDAWRVIRIAEAADVDEARQAQASQAGMAAYRAPGSANR